MKTLIHVVVVIAAAVALRPYIDGAERVLVDAGLRFGRQAAACERSLRQVREAADSAKRVAEELL